MSAKDVILYGCAAYGVWAFVRWYAERQGREQAIRDLGSIG